MRCAHLRRIALVLCLSVLPGMLGVPTAWMSKAVGPYWCAGNLDPCYPYLLNSVLVAEGRAPQHADHPGTPVQMIGALALRIRYVTDRSPSLEDAVVGNPESNLRWINRFLLGAVMAATFFLGAAVFRLTGDLFTAWLCQAVSFLSVVVWRHLVWVSPEPLLMALSLTLGALALCHLRAASRTRWTWAVAFAVLVGVGVATKVTFVPLIVVPLFILPGWKNKVYYSAAAGVAFGLATFPIWTQYPRFYHWLEAVATHRGYYGGGAKGFDLPEYVAQLKRLALGETALLSVTLAAAAYALLRPLWRRRAAEESAAAPVSWYLLALSAAMAGQFLMVARHSLPRYLMPAYGLMGAALALVLFDLLRKQWLARAGRLAVWVGVLVLMTQGRQEFLRFTQFQQLVQEDYTVKPTEVLDGVEQKGVVVLYYGASDVHYALAFGNDWSHNVCGRVAAAFYPNVYMYNLWTKCYTDLGGVLQSPEVIFRPGVPVYFHGMSLTGGNAIYRPDGFILTPLLPEGLETVYEGHWQKPPVLPVGAHL